MRYLLDLAGDCVWLKKIALFVNHARIAELPLQMGLKVYVADAPGEEAMLKAIQANLLHTSNHQ